MDNLNGLDLENVSGGLLTKSDALARALENAELGKDNISFMRKVKLSSENGRQVYKVEFHNNGYEFNYSIDAETGEILGFSKNWI